MELYDTASTADNARFAAEVVLSIAVVVMVLGQVWDVVAAAFRPQGLRKYWSSPAHVMDAISNALLVVCCALWWAFVTRHVKTWSMDLRYHVSSHDARALALDRLWVKWRNWSAWPADTLTCVS